MSTCEVFFYSMCSCFILSCPVGLRSTIRCAICSFLLCPLVMWSFIIYVLSYFVFLVHADCFLHSMCYILYGVMSTRWFCYPVCPVIFSLVDSECFLPFDLSLLCIIVTTCDVSFHAMSHSFYFILCSWIEFPHAVCHMF